MKTCRKERIPPTEPMNVDINADDLPELDHSEKRCSVKLRQIQINLLQLTGDNSTSDKS
jgi:hypothetical protein